MRLFEVPCGQDPYNAIGKYIRDHINIIEDIIAVIEIDGVETNQLFMVNMDEDGYFIWKSDWYEGEEKVVLMDFFPVSEAINSSAQPTTEPERPKGKWIIDDDWISVEDKMPDNNADVLLQFSNNMGVGFWEDGDWAVNMGDGIYSLIGYNEEKPIAWMPLPEPYKERMEE